MKTTNLRVSRSYSRLNDLNLADFAGTVSLDLYADAFFDAVPVPQADLDAAIKAFLDAKAAVPNGGRAAAVLKNEARLALIAILDTLAAYVQQKCLDNLAQLLKSGFQPTRSAHLSHPLPKPPGVRIRNGLAQQALMTVIPVRNARGYEGRLAMIHDDGTLGSWVHLPFQTSSRKLPANDLESGKLYVFQARAMGGKTGASEWTDSITHRAY